METPTELVLKEVTDVDDDLSSLSLFGKILSQRTLNKLGVTNILNQAWKTKESFSISPWRDNIFLFRFKTASDKNFVLNSGPWSIMGHLLVLKEIQKGPTLEAMDFSLCPFWVQIHGLPITCMTSANAKKIGTQFEALIDIDGEEEQGGLILSRSFLRLRVMEDTSKPLLRGFFFRRPAVSTEKIWIQFKYERLSDFCFQCGRLGHEKNSCKFQPATLYGEQPTGMTSKRQHREDCVLKILLRRVYLKWKVRKMNRGGRIWWV